MKITTITNLNGEYIRCSTHLRAITKSRQKLGERYIRYIERKSHKDSKRITRRTKAHQGYAFLQQGPVLFISAHSSHCLQFKRRKLGAGLIRAEISGFFFHLKEEEQTKRGGRWVDYHPFSLEMALILHLCSPPRATPTLHRPTI